MSITFQITPINDTLFVKTSGKDDSLEEVMNYSKAIIEAAYKNNSKKIFCDERELEYDLSTFQTFEAGKFASQFSKYVCKIAIVCNPIFIEDGKFYETVATNRGLLIRVTSSIQVAEDWINK